MAPISCDRGAFRTLPLFVATFIAFSLEPGSARGEGLGIEALVSGSALTSKPAATYADQPGSAMGGMLRLSGGIAGDFRWIAGGIAEQIQRGAFLGPTPEHGDRVGGQIGFGWMARRELRLELVFEGGRRSDGTEWFNYWGVRPALTWMYRSTSGLGVIASLGLLWRKESPEQFAMAPAGDREMGVSLALGLSYE